MKKIILFFLTIYCTSSCTNNHILQSFQYFKSEKQPLIIKTQTWNTEYPYFKEIFTKGATIGLYILPENTNNIHTYKNRYAKAHLIKNQLTWSKYPEIYLYKEAVKVYAYYPYQSQININPQNIPIYIPSDASQTKDYMCGTQAHGQRKTNKYSPIALLHMKHTLSLLNIQIRLTPEVKNSHHLKAIQIGNKFGGTALSFKGSLNIQTGDIHRKTGINTSTRLNIKPSYPLNMDSNQSFNVMVIPTSQIKIEGDIEFIFFINEKRYKYLIPAQTKWEKGIKYSYDFLFDGHKITLHQAESNKW